jgi:hypothetical protein
MSQAYMASISRGDQSSNPFRQASLTAVMADPITAAVRFCTTQDINKIRQALWGKYTYLLLYPACVDLYVFYEISQTLDWFSTKGSLEHGKLKACLDVGIKIEVTIVLYGRSI